MLQLAEGSLRMGAAQEQRESLIGRWGMLVLLHVKKAWESLQDLM